MFKRVVAIAAMWMLCASALPAQAAVELKIATVAPAGSAWMRLFKKFETELAQATGGEVKLRFYPGQVQGDERDVVRKMGTGQLHGGLLTAVGLSLVNPEVLVLQMPTMFPATEGLDRARTKLADVFAATFQKRGYVLLGWGDVGPIHLFSTDPIKGVGELKKQKVWAWTDDPITKAMMRAIGVSPRLLGLPQVLPAMNTGIINTVYSSPLALLALQWHSKVKYISSKPFAVGIGASVITKKAFDQIKPEHQKILLALADKYHRAALKRTRVDNDRALASLRASFGLKTIEITPADWKIFIDASAKVMKQFTPRYYSQALLDQVLKAR
jgi:TRAP-type C4-dicarboxylate transport system substrate-binding protein